MKSLFKNSSMYLATAALVVFTIVFGANAQELLAQANAAPDLGVLFQQALTAFSDIRGGAIIAGLAVVVNLLTNLTKLPFIDKYLPAKARPLVALVLGVLTAVLGAKIAGQPWVNAIGAGVTAAFGSVFLHEIVQSFTAPKAEDHVAAVVAAAAAGDAAATEKVKALGEQITDIQGLPKDQQAAALAEWAKTHPPVVPGPVPG